MPVSPDLLAKYDRAVPRYTSYPTAPHFGPHIDATTVAGWMASLPDDQPVSIYLHLAYCKRLCLYCGCNMKVTHDMDVVAAYVNTMIAEIDRTAGLIGKRLKVSTVHMGGGTPSYCPPESMRQLFACINQHFEILPDAELSIEADPRQMQPEIIAVLKEVGINRASLGVQDSDQHVQKLIGREQPHELTVAAATNLRAAGIEGINVDLIYGLPGQTAASFKQTIEDILGIDPARIAMFGYAHVPWMKKHQVVLEQHERPDPAQRLELFEQASEQLKASGYVPVGIDHFAKPDDPMAVALQAGDLHRNFMGYTTDAAPILLGFGASSISTYPQGYAQNIVDIKDYGHAVAAGGLPVVKGIATSAQDRKVRRIIEDLTCHFRCDTAAAAKAEGLPADPMAYAQPALDALLADGLITRNGSQIAITEQGKPFTRVVAACFDEYLMPQPGARRHSQAV